jgi:glycerol 3-phosphatase-1
VGLYTTHTLEQLIEAGADYIVRDMRSVTLKSWDRTTGQGEIQIENALV